MTTPQKKYQNVSYAELLAFAEKNPNRTRSLNPIEIPTSTQDVSMDTLCLPGYTSCTLTPSSILSVVTCIQDPTYYSLSPQHVRIQQLIDISTQLQQQTDGLKNGSISRKRRKIHDLIGEAFNGKHLDDKDCAELYMGISHLCNLQFVLMKEKTQEKIEDDTKVEDDGVKGEIIFSTDPCTWKHDVPIWIADYRGRWLAVPSEHHAKSLLSFLSEWLGSIEQKGWTIQWPSVDGTKTELIERLSVLPSWKETDRKHMKDFLALRLGRLLTLQQFDKWLMSEEPK
jgi:hypothetical protein